MAIYRTFAENLRTECQRFQSIAFVCRGIGINRQQFNKYLSGKSLPNQRTLSRICTFLQVDDECLFASKKSVQRFGTEQSRLMAALQPLTTCDRGPLLDVNTHMPDGYYVAYFPNQTSNDVLTRSAVKLTTRSGSSSFIRHTFLREPRQAEKSPIYGRGKHSGVVLATTTSVVFIGRNVMSPYNFSMMTLNCHSVAGSNVYLGLANVFGLTHEFVCRTCMEWIGTSADDARRALNSAYLIAKDDPALNATVAQILAYTSADQQIGMPRLENLRFA